MPAEYTRHHHQEVSEGPKPGVIAGEKLPTYVPPRNWGLFTCMHVTSISKASEECIPLQYSCLENSFPGQKSLLDKKESIYMYIYHIFFIHSFVDGHLGCFHVLAIINSTSMSIGVHVSFCIRVFIFFRYTLRIYARSYGNSIFSVLRNLHTALPSKRSNVQWISIFFPL